MPLLPKILRSRKNSHADKKPQRAGGVFRRKQSAKTVDSSPKSINQGITWTMSDDSSMTQEPGSPRSPLLLERGVLSTEGNFLQETKNTVTFTEEEVMKHELNRIRGLAEKDTQIENLKREHEKTTRNLEKALEVKEDEYVELLIKLGEKQEELVETKEELSCVSAHLIQTQHKMFEEQNRTWRSMFS